MRGAKLAKSSSMMSMSHGVTTRSKDSPGKRRTRGVRQHELDRRSERGGGGKRPQDRVALGVARRDRKLVEGHLLAGEDPPRHAGVERVDVERNDQLWAEALREIVRQTAAARTEHQHTPRRKSAERVDDGGEPGSVFLCAPDPVAMQVDVVRGKALRTRDARAEGTVHLGCAQGAARRLSEGRKQRCKPARVILERRGLELEAIACKHRQRRSFERGTHLSGLAADLRLQRREPLSPIAKCGRGLREEPRHPVDDRERDRAAGTVPRAGIASERARATSGADQ